MTAIRPDQLISALSADFQENLGFVIIQDQKSSGTNGGTFTSGAWQTRDLTVTVHRSIGGYSLAANQFTLPKGAYLIIATAPGHDVNGHAARLQNVTDGLTPLSGSSEYVGSGDAVVTKSVILGVFAVNAEKTFEIQHQCQTTRADVGFGVPTTFAVANETFTQVFLMKIG